MDYIYHVSQAQKGEISSYEYLVNNFQGMSISYAYSILHDFQLAEDAAQEAFILLFNNIHNLKEPSAFPTWLKKLVFTCCNRIHRKQKPETSIEDISESFDGGNDPSAIFEEKERRELAGKALSHLNEGQQEVFLLYYTFNKSYAEIAVDLDITEAAVASRIHHGKKKLKGIMLSTMAAYLGGYKMDKNTFTRKIIEGIQNPLQPETQQGDGYVACFASLYMAVEKNQELNRVTVYNKFSTVAGLDFFTIDTMTMTSRTEPELIAKEYGFDDYVEYTMGYAGFKYASFKKGEHSEESIYKQITASLDNDIPVLMETKNGWCVVTGYDENRFMYGFDDKYGGHRLSSDANEYWQDLFVLHNWHSVMERVVIYTGKQTPTITKKDIFSRISRIIDNMQARKYNEKLIEKLSDDEYFNSLTDDEQKILFKQTLNFLYFHVGRRAMMCWGMGEDSYPDNSDEDMNLRQSINGYMGNTHDWCWFVFRTLGNEGGYYVHDDDFPNFLDSEKRRNTVKSMKLIIFNDYKTSCICKIIAGEYISALERYLNEPKYNIPRNQVGPVEMGPFTTEVVNLPDVKISYRSVPINECNKNNKNDVFLVKYSLDQGLFHYDKNVICGSNFDSGNAYTIPGGTYLKITDKLPISIYNIVDSWYETNRINLDFSKNMIIKKDNNGDFESYLPIIN